MKKFLSKPVGPSNDSMPEVDVILPFHKVDDFLFHAVESVFASRGVRISLLLVDDRPMVDQSFESEIIVKFSNHNFIILRTDKRGYANAVNFGLRSGKSEFVALMNSDDLVSTDRMINQIDKLTESQADICLGKIIKFSWWKKKIPSLSGTIDMNNYEFPFLLLGAYGADATILGKKSVLSNLIYPIDKRSADWVMALDSYSKLRIVGCNRALYYYRSHRQQATRDLSYKNSLFEEVYPRWKALNSELGLPELDYECARILAFPSEITKGTKIEIDKLRGWAEEFIKLFKSSESRQQATLLIDRRLLFYKFSQRELIWLPRTLIGVLRDFILIFIAGVRPR